ncbi:MAG: heavy metal translocating P-type ATPase [Clostridiales bacterium]|nr:heavy metal translocating P-type ATPase [Clostridiales bacterium]
MKQTFSVTGMTCAACSAHVEKTVSRLPGMSSAAVNLMTGSMTADYDEEQLTSDAIIAAVMQEGYGAAVADASSRSKHGSEEQKAAQKMTRRLLWSVILLIPLFYLGMGHMGLPLPDFLLHNHLLYALLQLLLLIPIVILNRAYFTVGFSRLLRGSPNMDSLVALGAAAGIVYSLIETAALLNPQHTGMAELYFESAGMILTLVTVGKYLEERSKSKTTDAITSLLALAPDAAVVRRAGAEVTVPVEEVAVGDTVIVRQGGKIPVDGIVTEGRGAVDESAITGESLPVEKGPGDAVTSATVSRSGYLEMQATRVGADTTLSQIVHLMEEAASSKAPISRLADKISGVFVPVVIGIALVAALLWYFAGNIGISFSLSIGIAVLVISCPCALGLATPVAIMVGTGKAAEHGILIKSAESLERMQSVSTVVLDKTGTVTEGRPAVTDLLCGEDITPEELLCLAASMEKASEHPLSLAIVEEAGRRNIPLCPAKNFAAVPGGVSASIDGDLICGGNADFMASQQVPVSSLQTQAEVLAGDGKTPLYFAEEGRLLGVIAVADVMKVDSAEAVKALRREGCDVILLTGDNRRTAEAIAKQVGIDHVMAEVLPQDKEQCVASLQKDGKVVAMVGDGINDAPALVRADVGLAIGAGTDIAIESADIVLMKSSLTDIVSALRLSRAVIRNIKENLFWAFFYNTIGIPIAAGVLYPWLGLKLNPMIAAAAMSVSSVCVVLNALRLRRFKSATRENIGKEVPVVEAKTIFIEGMMCAHCSGRVEKALNDLPGVTAKVDLEAKKARVECTGAVSNDTLRKAVEDAGYTVTGIQ